MQAGARLSSGPFIIAVAGMPGAGKSTLIRDAISYLGDADSIHFDDYTRGVDYPNVPEWVASGCDPNQWVSPGMSEDLAALKNGVAITTPLNLRRVQPHAFIFVEEPFGKARTRLAAYFDFVVVIDLPIDISLARRLVRDINGPIMASDAQRARDHVDTYCRKFLYESRRELILAGQRCALDGCDLVLDGLKPIDVLTQHLIRVLRSRRS